MPEDRGEGAFRDELLETMFGKGPGRPAAELPTTPPGGGAPQVAPGAASRYAEEMRTEPRFRGRGWDEAEPELRRAWEARHRGAPWEQVREVVREVWGQGRDAPRSGVEREGTLQLREEELRARKRAVEAGEVEIRKEVVTETRTVEVPVRREQLVIERQAGDHTEGEPIRIPLREQPAGEARADSAEGPGAGADRPGR